MDASAIVSIISAVTALAAVFIGPFVTLRVSKKAVLAPMRQAWINSLRDTVAEFIANIYVSPIQLSGSVSNNDEIRHQTEVSKQARLESACKLKEKVCLLVNPNESTHQELMRLVEHAYLAQAQQRDTSDTLAAIRTCAQSIFKTEWNVVKR